MNAQTLELPDRNTIKRFVRPGRPVQLVEKNGVPAAELGNVRSEWMDVTPEKAARWLKNNFVNRPVSDDVVAAYARDMFNGVWQATHQGAAFNDRDELIDGQHRLLAIVRCGKTIRMMVTFGLPSKIAGSEMTTMDCVDRGRTRSVADQLKIQHGLKDGRLIAQVAAALSGLCYERIRRLSVGQTLDISREFKDGMDFVIEHRSKRAGLRSAGVLAGFAFVMQSTVGTKNPFSAMPRFTQLNSGENIDRFPAVKLLRDFLTGQEATLILSSMNRGIAELTVQVLYLELKERRVQKLELSMDGVNHFRAAQPERVAKVAAMFKLPATVELKPSPSAGLVAGQKLNSCECGRTYPGEKHKDGCPFCRKANAIVGYRFDAGIKLKRIKSDEVLVGESE